MTDLKAFDALVRSAGLSADIAASDAYRDGLPPAQQVAAGVDAAFAHAVGLGLVTITPLDSWPEMRRLRWSREDLVEVDGNE